MGTQAAAGVSGSVERVRAVLSAHGHVDSIIEVAATARTAEGAAAEVGCGVAQIVKSMVFRSVGE